MARLRGEKAAGVCSTGDKLLRARGNALTRELHAISTTVSPFGTSPDWIKYLISLSGREGYCRDCKNYRCIALPNVPGNFFAHLLLIWTGCQELKLHRPVLVEFRRGMQATYVDLKTTTDSVHREALWDFLLRSGISLKIIDLLTGSHFGTGSAVKCGEGLSSFFSVNTDRRLCSIAFRHLNGLGIRQSGEPKSCCSVCR